MNIKRMPENYGDFGVDAASVEIVRDKKAPYLPIIKAKGGGGGGTIDHSELENRDLAGQHPIGAIEGLQEALDELADACDIEWNTLRNKPFNSIGETMMLRVQVVWGLQ